MDGRTASSLLACLWLTGCGASLSDLSAGEIGCPPSYIVVSNVKSGWHTKTWTASCGGVTYQCTEAESGGQYARSLHISCAPMTGSASAGGEGPPAGPSGERASTVERTYDEATDRHGVEAEFALPRGSELRLTGDPDRSLVHVRYETPSTEMSSCDALEILINDVPHSARDTEQFSRLGGRRRRLSGTTDFAWYAPLRGPYPQLAVRACLSKVPLHESQIPSLQKFLVIYAELADHPSASSEATAPTDEGDDEGEGSADHEAQADVRAP